jgi:hypothetical protein
VVAVAACSCCDAASTVTAHSWVAAAAAVHGRGLEVGDGCSQVRRSDVGGGRHDNDGVGVSG